MIRFVAFLLAAVAFVAYSLGDTLNVGDRHLNFLGLGFALVVIAVLAAQDEHPHRRS